MQQMYMNKHLKKVVVRYGTYNNHDRITLTGSFRFSLQFYEAPDDFIVLQGKKDSRIDNDYYPNPPHTIRG
jgi:hypothetical protein